MANYKGNVHPNWAASVKSTPELQEKKRRTYYATRAAWIAAGRPRKIRRLRMWKKNLPKSYTEAKVAGKLYYFTGKPCHKGHLTVRHVDSRHCYECTRQRAAVWNERTVKMPTILNPVTVHREMRYKEIVL